MEKANRVKTRITMRENVRNHLEAAAKKLPMDRNELADKILAEWLKENVRIEIAGEEIKLSERPGIRIDGSNVRIVRVDVEGGKKL